LHLHPNIFTGEDMTQDEIIEMAKRAGFSSAVGKHIALDDDLERFAKLVAQHEREACAYWAGIALLGADRGLSNRVDQAIRARGQA
jgi:hypothetical protein